MNRSMITTLITASEARDTFSTFLILMSCFSFFFFASIELSSVDLSEKKYM